MSKVGFYTKFSPPPAVALDFTDSPSLARQEFEAECNINNILKKFKVTGVLVDPSVRSLRQPMFLDCTSVPDMQEYHALLTRVGDEFSALPDEVRAAFGDDPVAAMHWFSAASDRQVLELWRNVGLDPAADPAAAAKNALPSNGQAAQPPAAAASAAAGAADAAHSGAEGGA